MQFLIRTFDPSNNDWKCELFSVLSQSGQEVPIPIPSPLLQTSCFRHMQTLQHILTHHISGKTSHGHEVVTNSDHLLHITALLQHSQKMCKSTHNRTQRYLWVSQISADLTCTQQDPSPLTEVPAHQLLPVTTQELR